MDLVPKPEWAGYFNRITRGLVGLRAEIDVASLELGDQVAADQVAVAGIFYDHRDDLLGVLLDGFDHLIRHPELIYAEERDAGLAALAVIDRDGTNHLIKFSRPLALPSPSH